MNLIFASAIGLVFVHYVVVLVEKADLKKRYKQLEETLLEQERQAQEQARQIEEMRREIAIMPTYEELIRGCERFYDDCYRTGGDSRSPNRSGRY